MQLSKDTLNKLKNFAEINQNVLIKSGSSLTTLSSGKNVMATAQVPEVFQVNDNGFGIYDLNEFLGMLSLFENPDLQFSDKYVTLSEGNTSIKYFAADPSVLTFPTKSLEMPVSEINFPLSAAMLQSIRKVAAVLKTQFVSLIGDGTNITLQVGDRKNATANSYNSVIGTTDKEFSVIMTVDNLKLLPGDYDVSISSKKISRFTSTDMTYFVAIEATSTFPFIKE
jgi:hypothetical protein